MSYRLKRLANDAEEVQRSLISHSSIMISKTVGTPPEKYEIEYRVKGLEIKGEGPVERTSHRVEIVLTLDYPRIAPKCRMLTPVFHPNISPDAICIVDHWAAGESLLDIIFRIGEMICYQNYNIKSPRNGEAAKWASENLHRFPLDEIDLRSETMAETEVAVGIRKADPSVLKQRSSDISIGQLDRCSNCGASADKVGLTMCSSGHEVCSECALECGCCAKSLCVLCELTKCSQCGEIVCEACRYVCASCHQTVCRKHVIKCASCDTTICSKCASACVHCGNKYCLNHFNAERSACTRCLAALSARDTVSREPAERGSVREMQSRSDDHCAACGATIEDREARFCEMCGSRRKLRSVGATTGKPSEAKRYRIMYEGNIAQGKSISEVKSNMTKVFKIDKSRIDALFEGRRFIFLKELDYASAMKYKAAFEKETGAVFRVEEYS